MITTSTVHSLNYESTASKNSPRPGLSSPYPAMSSRPKQSMSELKLRRLMEHNQRLREDLARPRIRVSEASASLIRYCKTTKDHLVRDCSSLSCLILFCTFGFRLRSPSLCAHPCQVCAVLLCIFAFASGGWSPAQIWLCEHQAVA